MKRATFITWEQLKVGAIILAAVGILTVAVFKLGRAANLFASRYELVAIMSSTQGLREGGSVTIAGQLAGRVKAIEFLPVDGDTSKNLKLTFEIDEKLREQVRGDSKGKLRTLGLLGDKVFDISPGTPRYAVLRPGDTIPVAPSLDYEQVIAQASGAVGDLVQLTRDMREITGGIVRGEGTVGQLVTNRTLYDELTTTLSRANDLVARLSNPNGTIGRLVDDPTLYRNMTNMIASVDTLMRAVNNSNGTLSKLLKDDSLYVHLKGIAAGGDSLIHQLNNGEGSASKMLSDPQLYDQLVKAVTDLNAILADVQKNPKKYTKGLIRVF